VEPLREPLAEQETYPSRFDALRTAAAT